MEKKIVWVDVDEFNELVDAALEMTKFGAHDGPCDTDDPDDACPKPCFTHLKKTDERLERLMSAINTFRPGTFPHGIEPTS